MGCGGEAASARATITTKTNVLIISPPSQTGPRAPISYNVAQAGPGATVVIGVGVTSTTGVAAGQWTQPTETTPGLTNSRRTRRLADAQAAGRVR